MLVKIWSKGPKYSSGRNVIGAATMETVWTFLKKLKKRTNQEYMK